MKIAEKIERHVRVLCEEIGARPTGSQENLVAVDYISGTLEAAGLSVRRQTFDCMHWVQNGGSLKADGQEIPMMSAPYSLPCDVKGEIVCVDSLKQLRSAQINGKIVLLRGELAEQALMPKSFVFWNPEEHKEIIHLLETGKPLSVLMVSLLPERFAPVIEDGDFALPCAVIMQENTSAFYDGAFAELKISAERLPATSANVIATYGDGEKKVCFSAHIDTKEGTPGALDNASGIAVLLELAEALSGREYPFAIEFALFNGEDYYSTPGEMAYFSAELSRPEAYAFACNVDGVGLKKHNLAYSFYKCTEAQIRCISESAAGIEGLEEMEAWMQGDHMLFSVSGVPAMAVTSCGIFELTDTVLHTADDTPALLDFGKLETLVKFLLDILSALGRAEL